MRYRLRFLLQEFDLPIGSTVVGRSVDCNLTIEDPLVSRQHARIIIDEAGARVEDLNSRNGVRVNGVVVRGSTALRDGDRVRVGTQDLVFCSADPAGQPHMKTTGVLRLCANCRLPYPREMVACPHCEATEQTDEGTLTGEEEQGVSWTVQLLVEALERALTLGRVTDAERIVRRAAARLDEYLGSGGAIEPELLNTIAAKVLAVTLATGTPTWAVWVIDLYRRLGAIPSLEVTDRLAESAAKCGGVVSGTLGELLTRLRTSVESASEEEIEALTRLEGLWRLKPAETRAPESGSPRDCPTT